MNLEDTKTEDTEQERPFPSEEDFVTDGPDMLDALQKMKSEDTEADTTKSTLDPQTEEIKQTDESEKTGFESFKNENKGLWIQRNKIQTVAAGLVVIGLILGFVVFPNLKMKKKQKNPEIEKRGNVYIPTTILDDETDEPVTNEEPRLTTDELEKKYPPIVENQNGKAPVNLNSGSGSSNSDFPVTNRNEQQKQLQRLTLDDGGSVFSSNKGSVSTSSSYRGNSSSKGGMTYTPTALSSNLQNFAAGSNTYESQNNQSNKQNFLNQKVGANSMQWNNDISLWKGTVISAVLDTGVNTDLPGQLIGHVTTNVYSSKDGQYLLIPQGSRIFGEYNSMVSYGQVRVQVVWNTLIRPDGLEIELGSMNGIDNYGFSGYKGWKSDHPFEYLRAMGLIAMFSILDTKMAGTIDAQNNVYAQNAMSDVYSEAKQLNNKIIERAMDIQPTITIQPGTEVKLITNLSMDIPPVENIEVTEKYVRN